MDSFSHWDVWVQNLPSLLAMRLCMAWSYSKVFSPGSLWNSLSLHARMRSINKHASWSMPLWCLSTVAHVDPRVPIKMTPSQAVSCCYGKALKTRKRGSTGSQWLSLGKKRQTWCWHPILHGHQGKQLWHLCHTHDTFEVDSAFWGSFCKKDMQLKKMMCGVKNAEVPALFTLVKYVPWVFEKWTEICHLTLFPLLGSNNSFR